MGLDLTENGEVTDSRLKKIRLSTKFSKTFSHPPFKPHQLVFPTIALLTVGKKDVKAAINN